MTTLANFEKKVELINNRRDNEAVVINAAIAATKADFDQFDGITLLTADPITGVSFAYTTLSVDTSTYNGTSDNAIEISLDGGSTLFSTVTSHADDIQYNPPHLYYKATKKELDGTLTGAQVYPVFGSNAYEIITALGIQSIAAP